MARKKKQLKTNLPKIDKPIVVEPEESNSKPLGQKEPGIPFVKILIILLLVTILSIVGLVGGYIWWFSSSFSQAAGVPITSIKDQIKQGLSQEAKSDDGRTNFLILGIDEIEGQKENSLLTDTIIVMSLNHQTNTLTTLALPRDLWIDSLKTKINALYYYGENSDETTGEQLASSIVSEITGLPVHYTLTIKLSTLEQIINSVNGVEIDVPNKFTDPKFPRNDVDPSIQDESLLYETITFEQGLQTMDGQTALKYIRSRHSEDLSEGNDLARSARQQQLIQAIIAKLKTKQIGTNPHILGNLYALYDQQISPALPLNDLVALGNSINFTPPQFSTLSLTITDDDTEGIIFNPPVGKYNQWVYEPTDPTWRELQTYVSDNL